MTIPTQRTTPRIAAPSSLLAQRLQRLLQTSAATPIAGFAKPNGSSTLHPTVQVLQTALDKAGLSDRYEAMVTRQLASRLQRSSDFETDKFPAATRVFVGASQGPGAGASAVPATAGVGDDAGGSGGVAGDDLAPTAAVLDALLDDFDSSSDSGGDVGEHEAAASRGDSNADASSSTAPKLAEEGGNGGNGHSLASTAAVVDALLDEMGSSDEDSTAGNEVDDGTAAQGGDHALAGHDAEALEGLLDELLSDDD